jgi:hypothetical protein
MSETCDNNVSNNGRNGGSKRTPVPYSAAIVTIHTHTAQVEGRRGVGST